MADQKFETAVQVCKVDSELGLVFGFACICKEDGKPYFDRQNEHIPEDVMLEFATDFMKNSRVAKEMHDGESIGSVVYALPLTQELADSLELTTKRTGLIIGMVPNSESMKKFQDGELTAFSIGGFASYEEVEE